MKTKPRNYDNWQDKAIARIGDVKRMAVGDLKAEIISVLQNVTARQPEFSDTFKSVVERVMASNNLLAISVLPSLLESMARQPELMGVLITTVEEFTGAEIPEMGTGIRCIPFLQRTPKSMLIEGLLESMARQPELETVLKCATHQLINKNDRTVEVAGIGLLESMARQPEMTEDLFTSFNLFFSEDPVDFSSCLVEN